jgi:glycosyltransferase involved in cell wall biosynthesis
MEPYLSIVVTSLDFSHENPLQVFVTATLDQCRRFRIPSELIIVEWKRPEEQEPLAEGLLLPAEQGSCALRVIEVPPDTVLADELASSVGIRRARGRFVLEANTGAAVSEDLLKFIAEQYQRFSSLERNDIAANDGRLALGKGWFSREMDGSKPFRWFNNDAEISVQPLRESARVLAIDIEPGPGVNMGPTTLDVLDDGDAKLLSVRLARRSLVNIPVSNHNGQPIRLRLRVSDTGHRRSSDPRPLNARVLRCGLYEAPVTARQWGLPQRIWWMLKGRAGTSLLPESQPAEEWPSSPCLGVNGPILPRTRWLEMRDADWGLGSQELKETQLIEIVDPSRRRNNLAVEAMAIPLAWFFHSIPRPQLPPPGAFDSIKAPAESLKPLDHPPKISMVTPSYQQGHFLEWTIRSVLEQGYANLDYVVMDGGSTDGTKEILARYRDRLTYCESAPDRGQADAVVRGFEHTSGEIMAYLNSDDLLAPGALDFVARFFAAHPEIDAIYSHRVFIDEQNTVTRHWILPPHRNWMMTRWDYIPQETCFWRRRIYDKVGGIDQSFQFALDYDLFVRFMREGRMERVDRFLGAFREHPSSKTTRQEGAHPEVERVHRERGIHLKDWHRLPQLAQFELLDLRSRRFAAQGKILPGALAGIGYDYDLVWGGRLNGWRSFSRSMSDTPRI